MDIKKIIGIFLLLFVVISLTQNTTEENNRDKINELLTAKTLGENYWRKKVPTKYPKKVSPPKPRPIVKNSIREKSSEEKLLQISSGTGFFINKQGYFVSNNHVVEICHTIKTEKQGVIYDANIISVDKVNDLAIGKINFLNNEYIPMSDGGAMLGEDIMVAGYPLSSILSESVKITKGIISSLSGIGNDFGRFQMDAAVQAGNSGGPIINNIGDLVGITVSKANAEAFYEQTGSVPENINFGIKVETLKTFLKANKIKTKRKSFFSDNDPKTGTELASRADGATIHLQCWNTMAALKEIANTNQVRNLLVSIE